MEITVGDLVRVPGNSVPGDQKSRVRLVVASLEVGIVTTAYITTKSADEYFGAQCVFVDDVDTYSLALSEPSLVTVERVYTHPAQNCSRIMSAPALLADWRRAAWPGLGIASGSYAKIGGEMRRGRVMSLTEPDYIKAWQTREVLVITSPIYGAMARTQVVVPLYPKRVPEWMGPCCAVCVGADERFAACGMPFHVRDSAFEDKNVVPLNSWVSSEAMAEVDHLLIGHLALQQSV